MGTRVAVMFARSSAAPRDSLLFEPQKTFRGQARVSEAAGPTLRSAIWTVGHSTHSGDDFLALLAANGIDLLADVRRFPGSRANPQFSRDALTQLLVSAGIEYQWFPELGGRRRPKPDSANVRWRNASFRGYADYMETQEFQDGLRRLLGIANQHRVAVMCSEALWWRCHRALISDVLKAAGVRVAHIQSTGEAVEHPYTSAARVEDGKLDYGSA